MLTFISWNLRKTNWGENSSFFCHRIGAKLQSFAQQYHTLEIGAICVMQQMKETELRLIHSFLRNAIQKWPIDHLYPLIDYVSRIVLLCDQP